MNQSEDQCNTNKGLELFRQTIALYEEGVKDDANDEDEEEINCINSLKRQKTESSANSSAVGVKRPSEPVAFLPEPQENPPSRAKAEETTLSRQLHPAPTDLTSLLLAAPLLGLGDSVLSQLTAATQPYAPMGAQTSALNNLIFIINEVSEESLAHCVIAQANSAAFRRHRQTQRAHRARYLQ